MKTTAIALVALLGSADAHGYLSVPRSRGALSCVGPVVPCPAGNVNCNSTDPTVKFPIKKHNNMNMNSAQGAVTQADGLASGAVNLGICGDVVERQAFADDGEYGLAASLEYIKTNNERTGRTFKAGSTMDVELTITTHHWGWSEFRLCQRPPNGSLTQECLNDHVLEFDMKDATERYGTEMRNQSWKKDEMPSDPSDFNGLSVNNRCEGKGLGDKVPAQYSPIGSCCRDGGECTKPESNTQRWVFPKPNSKATPDAGFCGSSGDLYTIKLKIPAEVKCDDPKTPCTLQWVFMTGNSPDSYPEVFKACSDVWVTASGSESSTPPLLHSQVRSKLRGRSA